MPVPVAGSIVLGVHLRGRSDALGGSATNRTAGRAVSSAGDRRRSAARAAPLAILVVAAVLPYARLLTCPLYPDAERAVTKNVTVARGSLIDALSADFWGRKRGDPEATGSYRPAVTSTYWLQLRVFGAGPAALHAFDMLLHAATTVLVFLWLQPFVSVRPFAFAAALLFAVHPALSEAVCSVVGRADLLAGVSFLAALLWHRRATRSVRPNRCDAAALAALGIALLAKEYAVVFPFVVLLFDVLPSGTAGGRDRRMRFWVLMLALLAGYLVLRVAILGALGKVPLVVAADTPLAGRPFVDRLANAVWLLLPALWLLVLPTRLDHIYGVGTLPVATGTSDPHFLVALGACLATAAFGVLHWRRQRDGSPLLALAIFALPLLPALNTVGVTVVLFAERFLYVPAVGFVWMLAWTASHAARGAALRTGLLAVLLAAAVLFATLTARRVEDWRSNEALARSALRVHPHSGMALHEVGMALAVRGEYEQALPFVRASLDVQGRPLWWRNYALLLERLGRSAEARAAWARGAEASR